MQNGQGGLQGQQQMPGGFGYGQQQQQQQQQNQIPY